jgi:hypothetical protein
MTNEVENLILEHLRQMRADIGQIKQEIGDIKTRMLSIESYMGATHLDSVRHSTRSINWTSDCSALKKGWS